MVATLPSRRLADGRHYEPTVFAARQARRFVDDLLGHWGWDGPRASAALLTSELVAEALRQGPSSIAVHVEQHGETARVDVAAVEPGLIDDASNGRLERQVARRLVDELAREWGSEVDRARTTIWFSLPVSGSASESEQFAMTEPA